MPNRSFTVDPAEYPFTSHWFEHKGSWMHYVDEGQGIPVVMCHGNPTWSYLYRHIIKKLSPQFRCIAYDLPGFGFSGHPAGYRYTPMEHAEWVEALLLEHLKLDKFIIIGQDWGGPISMQVATRNPDKILGLENQLGR
jgi:haloalkane dehalogenase